MQTNLPDLPYNPGKLSVGGLRTASHWPSERTRPKTDLQALTHWDTFPAEIHAAVVAASQRLQLPGRTGTSFFLPRGPRRDKIVGERDIWAYATYKLHKQVECVAHRLGVKGEFMSTSTGYATLGNPDFCWMIPEDAERARSKVVVEYKTWWSADLPEDLQRIFKTGSWDYLEQQSLEALHQVYSYMVLNCNKYGILTNWKRALFLRRPDPKTSESESESGNKTLEYFLLDIDAKGPMSMLKAWVGLVLLADSQDDWFCPPPAPLTIVPVHPIRIVTNPEGGYEATVKCRDRSLLHGYDRRWPEADSDFDADSESCLCVFDTSFARGSAVAGRLLRRSPDGSDLDVSFKLVDVVCDSETDPEDLIALGSSEDEANAYEALKHLQGHVIPELYGFYDLWGTHRVFALQPVGEAIPEEEIIDDVLREKMKRVLQAIHDAGYVYGSYIARHNYCRTDEDDVFLVDLEGCRLAKDPSEFEREMHYVDCL